MTLADMGGAKGEEPIGSMGNDFALAVLSDRGPLLYSYFKQLFAQVTNPPIDPIREKIVMSVSTSVGPEGNLLDETPEHAHQLIIGQPLLTTGELEKLRQVDHHVFRADTLDATWPVSEGEAGLERALGRLCREASAAIAAGDNILILSDRARRRRARSDPGAAGGRRRAPPPGARGHAPAGGPGGGVRRAARGAPHRLPARLRRLGRLSLPRLRDALRACATAASCRVSTAPTTPRRT